VRELVDAFSSLFVGSVDDASDVEPLDVEPQNERPVHVQLPLEEILREVVSESRRELPGHRVHDVSNTIGDDQGWTAAVVPDLAQQTYDRLRRRSWPFL
jgi:hypothetical protein